MDRVIIYIKRRKEECIIMSTSFSQTLRRLRKEKGLSQIQLGKQMFVDNSTIARWENGSRLPDAAMITRLSKVLDVNISMLLSSAAESDEAFNIIMVDDNKAILSGNLMVLEKVLPDASIVGFNWPKEAIEYAKMNRIDLAILDIELGTASGFDLCRTLLEINPCTRVVYLTAYPDYALDAWNTDACGFMVKPLTPESVSRRLKKLHYPSSKGGMDK